MGRPNPLCKPVGYPYITYTTSTTTTTPQPYNYNEDVNSIIIPSGGSSCQKAFWICVSSDMLGEDIFSCENYNLRTKVP
jgi:hypothetical protein